MKNIKYILGAITGAALMVAGTVYATQISVPSATQYGQVLIGQSTGNYTPTATSSLKFFGLTTTGSSGAATYTGGTLNIPNYSFTDTSFSTTSASYWITATTSLPSITTLAGLSLPYSQLTGTPRIASTTLLGDTNTFSGTDTFNNTITGSITGNAGTVTNGVYTTTFNGLFDNRLSASSSISGITTLPNLSSINSYSGLLAGNTGKLYQVSTTSMNASITGSAGSVANAVTFNNGGSGASSGQTFNGSGAVTISYNTIGAQVAGSYESPLTFNTPMIRTSNTINWVGLATTSQPSSSNLLVSNGLAGVYGVATSTLSASSPLTGSFTQIGSGGSLGCQTASGSQAGCLSSTDWTTFNNKIGWGQATSTAANQFVYTNNNGLFVSAASSSFFGYTPLNPTRNINTTFPLQGGGDLSADRTFTFGGLSTSSAIAAGGAVLYATGVNTMASVGTTSATCSNGVTCTGFNVLGSSNPSFALSTINAGVLGAQANGSTPTSQATSTLYGNGTPGQHLAWLNGVPSWTATTTFSCSSGLTCSFSGNQESYSIGNNALTLAMLPTLPAGDIWANNTAATGNALAIATSSIFGTGTGGQVLTWNNGVPQWVGTTTNSCSNGVTCTFSGTTWTFSAPGAAFPFTPATYNAIAVNSTTTPLYVTSAASGFGLIASSTFATYASSTQATIGSSFYIDGFGNVTAKDVSTGDIGLLSPHQHLTLQTGTTTTWTATTSGPYIPLTIATFSGTLKFAKCYATSTTATDAFLGTEIDINGAPVTPKYLIASTTLGTTTLTAANTFKTGDRISAKFGTTTTAGTTYSASCTVDAVQTS